MLMMNLEYALVRRLVTRPRLSQQRAVLAANARPRASVAQLGRDGSDKETKEATATLVF